MADSPITENTKSIRKIFFFLIPISFLLGALVMFLIGDIINQQKGKEQDSFFTKDLTLQKKYRAGGSPLSKKDAEEYTDEFYRYLKLKVPADVDFNSFYTAGVSFTAHELWNYLDVLIKDNPVPTANDLKVYLCVAKYPAGKLDPDGKNVGNRLTACLVAEKAPFSLIAAGRQRLNIVTNMNCVNAFNWGDLEP